MFITGANISPLLTNVNLGLILCGFGMFLFGCTFMGNALKNYAGDRLREYIEKYTRKPWQGIIIGALVTALVQSSSATTAITIGLIRAGLMKLNQAVGIIMGANIGTTITAFLIGFDLDTISLYSVFIGTVLFVFSNKKKVKYLGEFFIGFGLLFIGLNQMGDALSPIYKAPEFADIINYLTKQPVISLVLSTVITGIIQSSAALIAIVQKMYESGSITLAIALPFLFGSNIGTTITAVFACLGGSVASKRAATIHVLFNVCGSILFMIFLKPFESLITLIAAATGAAPTMQVAIAHIIFNVIVTILFYPFINQIVILVQNIVRGEEKKKGDDLEELLNVDVAKRLPSSALSLAHTATIQMGHLCADNILEVMNYFENKQTSTLETVSQIEETINGYDKKIQDYLIVVAQEHLNNDDAHHYMSTMQIIKNLERISDLCCNLTEFFEMANDAKEEFSDIAKSEIKEMLSTVHTMMNKSIECYDTNSVDLYHDNKKLEDKIDLLEDTARKGHIRRMQAGDCDGKVTSSIYVDIVGIIERMGDHACNISRYTISHERAIGRPDVH